MNIIYADYNIYHNSIDICTYAGYILRIDCAKAEEGLKTNIAVSPVGNALEEMLIVPGHMIPTENPHTIHPASPMIGFSENDANK